MNITEFSMSLNKTVNLGDFESLKVQVGATLSTTTEKVDNDRNELDKYLHASLETIILRDTQKVNRGIKQRPAITEEY